jgi:hypothetical protein
MIHSLLLTDDLSSIAIAFAVFLDDDRLVTIAIVVTLRVAGPDRHANRPNADPRLLGASGHCGADTRGGGDYHCKTSCHVSAPVMVKPSKANPLRTQSFRMGAAYAKGLACRLSQTIFVHQWPRLRPQYPPPPNSNKTTMRTKSISMGLLRSGQGIATLPLKGSPLWIWVDGVTYFQHAVEKIVPKSCDRDCRLEFWSGHSSDRRSPISGAQDAGRVRIW